MANPSIKRLTEKSVELIASNVTILMLCKHWLKGRDMMYVYTTRLHGQSAPTEKQIADEGIPLFFNSEHEIIESSDLIDVYVYCNSGDGDTEDQGYLIVESWAGLGQVMSYSKTGVVTTDYASDAIAAGKGFQIQRLFTVTDEAPLYLVLDTSGMAESGKRLALLPLAMHTAGGNVKVETYPIESHTGGTEIKFARLNTTFENFALSKLYTGATVTGEPNDEYREYSVGTKSTHQASGGGIVLPDIPKMFTAGSIITAKCSTTETDPITLDFGLIIFEY